MTEREYEELYRKEERLGILYADEPPSAAHLAMARADVERFGREMVIEEGEEQD